MILKRAGLLALASALVLATSNAHAGRPRTGTVMTPFGPLYNTGSPEYRMSGGNPLMLQQLMYQKAMMQQQKMLMKQQQMLMKQQQQQQKNKKNGTNSSLNTTPGTFSYPTPATIPPHRKKKRRTYIPKGASAKATAPSSTAPNASLAASKGKDTDATTPTKP